MANNWHGKKTPDERSIMIRYANISRFIVCLGLFFVSANIVIIHIASFLGKLIRTETNITDIPNYPLTIQTSYFYDITKGHRYIWTKLSQSLYIFVGGFLYTLPDGLFAVLVLHTCAQLEIISGRLETIVKSSQLDLFALKSLVLKHYDIIRFVAVIEDIFSLLILSSIFLFTVFFTVVAFQLLNALTGNSKIPLIQTNFYVMYVVHFMFLMFIYSWVGQNLIDQCGNLGLALYNCDWYSLSLNQFRQTILMLIRSQKPLVITIGKLAPVRLESFLQLMKTCAGYVSFLAAIKNQTVK